MLPATNPVAKALPESAVRNDPQRVAQAAAAGVGNSAEVHPVKAQVLTVPHTLRDSWESDDGVRARWERDDALETVARAMMGLRTVV